MYVGLKQPRGDGERYVTPARAAAKETTDISVVMLRNLSHDFGRHVINTVGLEDLGCQ